ncbi:hypothetical protein [Mycolicibacterium sphagni]|uniref:hypothetical protein n=1 Tax=Mycolicibacterium sphagni TaxID=1786 RepID=UPI0021F25C5F|nr:hypothetical protein [Mycolicibacterium sphagni]
MSAPSVSRELVPGYSLLAWAYEAPPLPYTSLRRLLIPMIAGLVVIVGATTAASLLAAAPPVQYACPPDCGQPPTGIPVQANPRFSPADGSWSVAVPGPGTAYTISKEDDGVNAVFTGGDGGTMELFGVPAKGCSAEQVVDDLLHEKQPDATVAYVLPKATVGYQLGYGAAIGPYRPFRPGDGPSLPSGANLQLAQDLGRYINSFQWKGDPPR